ncbi:hypothetical protein NHQ30_006158 [Ciborinia camelliae]|nr:hypothetical protein NHQ30_006158 [Ciborinia camelliae]
MVFTTFAFALIAAVHTPTSDSSATSTQNVASDDCTTGLHYHHSTLTNDLGRELVHIFVGAERKKFSVDKNLIRQSGDFFKAAFQENASKEGIEDKMDLPEDEPYIFEAFVNWMDTKKIGDLRSPRVEDEQYYHIPLIEFYIFAEKYQNKPLMNLVMDSLQDSMKQKATTLAYEEAKLIFEFTKSRLDHPLRRLAAAMMTVGILRSEGRNVLEQYGKFLLEVNGALVEILEYIRLAFRDCLHGYREPRCRVKHPGLENGFGIHDFHQHHPDKDCDCGSVPNNDDD